MSQRNPTQLRRDRALAARLHCEGWTQEEIAEEITRRAKASGEEYSVARTTIINDLKIVKKQWREDQTTSIEERVAKEIHKLEHVERVAWQTWRESQKKKRSRSIKTGGQHGLEKKRKIEGRDGNHRFLEVIFKCIDRRLTILESNYQPPDVGQEKTERIRKIMQHMNESVERPMDGENIKPVEAQVIETKGSDDNGKISEAEET